jgi:heme/copper-type cytochrome/quinol oxidase subunit 1
MQGAARLFFTLAILYFIAGLIVGLHMAISGNHNQIVAHAHIMLAGWVSSAIFAYFYHLFPTASNGGLAKIHFWVQAISGIVMTGSLLLLYGGMPSAEPGAAGGSLVFAAGVLLFSYISLKEVWKS